MRLVAVTSEQVSIWFVLRGVFISNSYQITGQRQLRLHGETSEEHFEFRSNRRKSANHIVLNVSYFRWMVGTTDRNTNYILGVLSQEAEFVIFSSRFCTLCIGSNQVMYVIPYLENENLKFKFSKVLLLNSSNSFFFCISKWNLIHTTIPGTGRLAFI